MMNNNETVVAAASACPWKRAGHWRHDDVTVWFGTEKEHSDVMRASKCRHL